MYIHTYVHVYTKYKHILLSHANPSHSPSSHPHPSHSPLPYPLSPRPHPTLTHPTLLRPSLTPTTHPHLISPSLTPPSFAPPSPLPPTLTSSHPHLKQMVRFLHLNVHFLLLLLLPFIPSSAQLVNGGTVLGQEVDGLGPPGLYPDLRTNTSLLQVELYNKGRGREEEYG